MTFGKNKYYESEIPMAEIGQYASMIFFIPFKHFCFFLETKKDLFSVTYIYMTCVELFFQSIVLPQELSFRYTD